MPDCNGSTVSCTCSTKTAHAAQQPVLYVCLLSNFTVATAQAVKHIRPEKVVAVSSPQVKKSGNEDRFSRLLKDWGLDVTILGSDEGALFPAERLDKSREWMDTKLRPLLEESRRPGLRVFANLTGSTKAAAIALDGCWDWDERHYTAEGNRDRVNVVGHPSGESLFSLPCLDLVEEARLLNDEVRCGGDPWRSLKSEHLFPAAEIIHEDYCAGQQGSILHRYEALLRALWFFGSEEELKKQGVVLEGTQALVPPGELQDLFLRLAPLHAGIQKTDQGCLGIPCDRKHAWVKFLSGGWWEVLVTHWLAEHEVVIETNFVIQRPGTRSQDTETDILVRCGDGEMRPIECKVAPPGSSGFNDMVKLLRDLTAQFGKTRAGFAISPAFWWNVGQNARESFVETCNLRNIKILASREEILNWVGVEPTMETSPVYPPVVRGRPAQDILREAEGLLCAWQDDRRRRFQELEEAFIAAYPDREKEFESLKERDGEGNRLLESAYDLGSGGHKVSALEQLKTEAAGLAVPALRERLEAQFKAGEKALRRFQADRRRKADAVPLSRVKPRPNKARPVVLPPKKQSRRSLPEPPAGLHPNDIRALAPAPRWMLLLDETGRNFGGQGEGKAGRFVGLLVNKDQPGLAPLPDAWHAIDCDDTEEIDRVFQAVLDAPCGVIGLTLNSVPETPSERWLDGMLALVDWVLRLLPLDGPTRIEVAIEGRPPFPPKVKAQFVARDALARLARAWPERARHLDVHIATIAKEESRLNGYVDAVAFSWGSQAPSSKERLKISGLRDTCLLTFDARAMSAFWDTWDQPGGLPPEHWADLVASPEARHPESIVCSLLTALAESCKQAPSRLKAYLEEVRRHLGSKSIHLGRLGAQVEWVHSILHGSTDLTPAMRLAWLTSRLARANHLGELEQEWTRELEELGKRLLDEDAPLVCHADLHLAVNATNRFEFSRAAKILEPWHDREPAVPGLRFWGQVQSSFGQIAAFTGDHLEAALYFDEAMQAFRRLSDPAESSRECSQTLCYRAISAMDDAGMDTETARVCLVEYFREMGLPQDLAAAAAHLAENGDPQLKYAHHALLRWIVYREDSHAWPAYRARRDEWQTEEGHPWPLIQLYRALLLKPQEDPAAMDLVLDAAGLAFSAGQGPTVQLIGACCRGVAVSWGNPWPEGKAILDELRQGLPHARGRIETLSAWMDAPQGDPRHILRAVLPFNFR